MAKFKASTVVHTAVNGPIRTAIEANGAALCLFQARARNDLVRDAMWQGGEHWRLVFLPRRFTDYAKQLGYRAAPSTMKRKLAEGRLLPLVWKGDLRDMATERSHTTARASKGEAVATIRIPGPPYMNQQPMVYRTIRSIPTQEIDRIAEIVGQALATNLTDAAPTVRSDNKLQSLSEAQSATLSRSKKPASRRAPGAPSRRRVA